MPQSPEGWAYRCVLRHTVWSWDLQEPYPFPVFSAPKARAAGEALISRLTGCWEMWECLAGDTEILQPGVEGWSTSLCIQGSPDDCQRMLWQLRKRPNTHFFFLSGRQGLTVRLCSLGCLELTV